LIVKHHQNPTVRLGDHLRCQHHASDIGRSGERSMCCCYHEC